FSVDERITCREEVSYQSNAAISGIRDVSGSIRRVEAETQKIAAGPHMLFPHNDEAKAETCARPEALQSPLFDQVIAEPSEPITRLVIAKARSSDDAQMNIGNAGRIGVAVFQAEIDHSADGQGKQLCIRKECGRQDLGQHIQRCAPYRIAHQRQIYEVLDLAAPEQ